jgi:hypothetical protein
MIIQAIIANIALDNEKGFNHHILLAT